MSVTSITNTDINYILDRLVKGWLKSLGDSSTDRGIGQAGDTDRAQGAADEIYDYIETMTGPDAIAAVISAAVSLKTRCTNNTVGKTLFSGMLLALDNHVRRIGISGVVNLDTFLQYRNVSEVTKWQTLQHWNLRELYQAWKTGSYPTPTNLYYEVLQGATHTNGMGKFVVSGAGTGTFTDGSSTGLLLANGKIDSTKYAGGFGQLKISGLAGSGIVTVTGIGFDPATEAETASSTWLTTVNANGTLDMTKGGGTIPADSLLIDVTNISIAAGITAGTIYVEARKPTGRPTLP